VGFYFVLRIIFGQIFRGYGESSGNIPGSDRCLSVPPAEFKEGNGTQTFLSGQKLPELKEEKDMRLAG
jgi:hypothetical protein